MSNPHLEHDLFGDAAGLVPSEPARPLPHRVGYLGLAVVFLALTFMPGLVDTLRPLQTANPVGEEARVEAERLQRLSWLDGSRGRWLEEQRKRRSRVRSWFLPTYSTAMLAGLGKVHDDLFLGRDNWLFLKARVTPPSVSDEQILRRAMDLLTALDDLATASGHRLVIVPIPRKASIALNQLPEGLDSRSDLETLLAAELADSGLDVVDLLPILHSLPQRWGETPYYAGDSHLTCVAMLEMAEAVAHRLDRWQPTPQRLGELRDLGLKTPRTDLMSLAGLDMSSGLGQHLAPEPRRCFTVLQPRHGPMQRLVDPQETLRVGWLGTSYSALSKVSVYLSHFIGEPVADYAFPGANALKDLQRRLEQRQTHPLPEILILEVPTYQLFDWNRHGGLLGVDLTPPAAASPDGRRPLEPAPSPDASES